MPAKKLKIIRSLDDIPPHMTEAEAAEFYDTHDLALVWDQLRLVEIDLRLPNRGAAAPDVEKRLADAIREQRIVDISDRRGRTRTVQPHALFWTRQGKKCLHCYQTGGYSTSGKLPNWRNPAVVDIAQVVLHDERFEVRPDYNPDNRRIFAKIEIAVPKRAA